MKHILTPTINNKDMDTEDFLYSDGTYDYCIVNGESLTKYFGKELGQYESLPIHMLMNKLAILDQNPWAKELLYWDASEDEPKYKFRDKLLNKISKEINSDLFGRSY